MFWKQPMSGRFLSLILVSVSVLAIANVSRVDAGTSGSTVCVNSKTGLLRVPSTKCSNTEKPLRLGAAGPQGIQGAAGPQGIQGAAGPAGPQGRSPYSLRDKNGDGISGVIDVDFDNGWLYALYDGGLWKYSLYTGRLIGPETVFKNNSYASVFRSGADCKGPFVVGITSAYASQGANLNYRFGGLGAKSPPWPASNWYWKLTSLVPLVVSPTTDYLSFYESSGQCYSFKVDSRVVYFSAEEVQIPPDLPAPLTFSTN